MSTAIRKHLGDFLAVLALVVIGLGVGGYILSQQRLRFPLVEEDPFTIRFELSDAQAVIPGQGQTIRVAGVRVGDIGTVELKDGKAIVRGDLDPEHDDLVHRDATALLRPKTGLKDMFIELDPGTKDQPLLPEDGVVTVANTAPDIDPDEVLALLDHDTRDYLKLLISGAGKGLKGRGDDLRETFARLGPLHRDVARLTEAIARRRKNLRRLVHNYSELVEELGDREGDLTRLVTASNSVFEALASEDQNVSATIAKLPGALEETSNTLPKVEALGNELGPALEALRPAFRELTKANAELLPFGREATPAVRNQIRPFLREARPYLADLRPAAKDLADATPDLTESFFELNRFFNMAAYNPGGAEPLPADRAGQLDRDEGYLYWVAWVAQNTVSIFNTADASGVFRRGQFTVSCDTLRDTILQESAEVPKAVLDAVVPALGLVPVINDPNLCGTSAP